MTQRNQRPELTWIGKENRPKPQPRILLEDAENSYHASRRVTDGDLLDNRLIFGDNLLTLKAVEAQRNAKRWAYFDAQDEIDHRRVLLIAKIEGKLQQFATYTELFLIYWRIA